MDDRSLGFALSAESLVQGVPKYFDAHPTHTLLDLIELAAATQRMAIRIRMHNPSRSDDLLSASSRIQYVAAGCLRTVGVLKDSLGRYECDEMLRSPFGQQALECALKQSCRIFLTQPEVQS